MEQRHLCANTDNENVKKFALALMNAGITDGAECYYTDEGFSSPFFKIPKAYRKETPNDPDVHYVFVDVDAVSPLGDVAEYTVHGNYVHEHIVAPEDAAELVAKLINEEVAEVALVLPDKYISCFINHTGDHEANVNFITNNMEYIQNFIYKDVEVFKGGHMHTIFPTIYPNNLQYGPNTRYHLEGISIYLVSSLIGIHPEFYIIR